MLLRESKNVCSIAAMILSVILLLINLLKSQAVMYAAVIATQDSDIANLLILIVFGLSKCTVSGEFLGHSPSTIAAFLKCIF